MEKVEIDVVQQGVKVKIVSAMLDYFKLEKARDVVVLGVKA